MKKIFALSLALCSVLSLQADEKKFLTVNDLINTLVPGLKKEELVRRTQAVWLEIYQEYITRYDPSSGTIADQLPATKKLLYQIERTVQKLLPNNPQLLSFVEDMRENVLPDYRRTDKKPKTDKFLSDIHDELVLEHDKAEKSWTTNRYETAALWMLQNTAYALLKNENLTGMKALLAGIRKNMKEDDLNKHMDKIALELHKQGTSDMTKFNFENIKESLKTIINRLFKQKDTSFSFKLGDGTSQEDLQKIVAIIPEKLQREPAEKKLWLEMTKKDLDFRYGKASDVYVKAAIRLVQGAAYSTLASIKTEIKNVH